MTLRGFCDLRSGVSLVGVMVVVAVIGIVIAMAVPAQMRSAQVRHARECQENLARIEGAVEALALEEGRLEDARMSLNDLVKTTGTGFLAKEPVCPAGGSYMVLGQNAAPVCSIGRNEAAPYAPHVWSAAIPQ